MNEDTAILREYQWTSRQLARIHKICKVRAANNGASSGLEFYEKLAVNLGLRLDYLSSYLQAPPAGE